MHILDILKERGFFAQVTFEDDLYKLLENERVTFYIGFDPTASSLHIGHYIQSMVMAHMQRAGHRPVVLIGGGTTMVGDPSGKTDLRPMLTKEEIDENAGALKRQMERFLKFGPDDAFMVNNADWLLELNYIGFLREVGVHFSVNRMLAAECYKQRLEKGLTFLEFNYMLMQSYDFLELNRRYGVKLQIGGDDQWSNILAGADLIRRKERREAFALTTPLLLTHDGRKMGKTEAGAIWLNADKTTPYEFFQYFRNVDDKDVEKCLSRLTFLPIDEIRALCPASGEGINEAKKRLAYEVTAQVHGTEAAEMAQAQAKALFEGGGGADAPSTTISREAFENANRVIDLLVFSGLAKSLGDARRLIAQGGVAVNGETTRDAEQRLSVDDFGDNGILLKKGKKGFHRILLG